VKQAYSESEIDLSRILLRTKSKLLSFLNAKDKNSISKFDLPQSEFIYTAMSEVTLRKESYFGHGQSANPIIASSRAFGEAIERVLAFKFMNDHSCFLPRTYKANCQRAQLSTSPTTIPAEFPPKELESSNGWAIHFTAEKAIEGAVTEAIERTILQSTFISDGWNGFREQSQFTLQGRRLTAWLSNHSFFGWEAGIIECEPLKLGGRTFGYFTHKAGSEFVWQDYAHSAFEALEPAIFLDSRPEYEPDPEDAIAVAQFEFATRDFRRQNPDLRQALSIPTQFSCDILLFDMRQEMDLDIPLYLAWCLGGDAVPLILQSKITASGLSFINQKLHKYGLFYDGRYEIPVI